MTEMMIYWLHRTIFQSPAALILYLIITSASSFSTSSLEPSSCFQHHHINNAAFPTSSAAGDIRHHPHHDRHQSLWSHRHRSYRFFIIPGHRSSMRLSTRAGGVCSKWMDVPRGGGGGLVLMDKLKLVLFPHHQHYQSPQMLFNLILVGLAATTAMVKILQQFLKERVVISSKSSSLLPLSSSSSSTTVVDDSMQSIPSKANSIPKSIQSLQIRFLVVFWLLRCADWLQGPYFYEVYASKVFHGVQASMSLVSQLFLTGFASTAIFGPLVGKLADQYGRKKATLAFTVLYTMGALSTKSPMLQVLFMGRIFSGIGTSLLFSAPESWLVGEAQKNNKDTNDDPNGQYLGETFGMAYSGDSIVAILAGQMASLAASQRGTTGPFELSTIFLILGGILAAWLWKENMATTTTSNNDNAAASGAANRSNPNQNVKPSIYDAVQVVRADPKIMLVGSVQSLFEAAMYIFVLQWPPAIALAITKAFAGTMASSTGTSTPLVVPYGAVFSCFMACCLMGSQIFGQMTKMKMPTEESTSIMLTLAAVSMTAATWTAATSMNLPAIVAAFFVFEACVGMYFPSIGLLRSRYIPDSHRSVIMNLFGIPLNALVVGVFLSINRLGLVGALSISSGALSVATICMITLLRKVGANKNIK